MNDINTFQEKLLPLIQKFEKDKHHYLSKDYLEAQVRRILSIPYSNPSAGTLKTEKAFRPLIER